MQDSKMMPDGWERLTCSCGQNRFAKVVALRWRQGAGVVEQPDGYFCMECHGVVDSAQLIQKAQVAVKRRELQELQDELEVDVPEPKVTPAKKEKAHATA